MNHREKRLARRVRDLKRKLKLAKDKKRDRLEVLRASETKRTLSQLPLKKLIHYLRESRVGRTRYDYWKGAESHKSEAHVPDIGWVDYRAFIKELDRREEEAGKRLDRAAERMNRTGQGPRRRYCSWCGRQIRARSLRKRIIGRNLEFCCWKCHDAYVFIRENEEAMNMLATVEL